MGSGELMPRAQLERDLNCHVFPSWLDALEHCGRSLRACRKSIWLDPPKRPMIFVKVNLLGGRPFRSMRRGTGQPRTEPARRHREYHRHRSRGRPGARDRGQWTGSASDLLQLGTNRSGWPKSPRALAGRLRRAQTFLRTLGIEIAFGREGRLGMRTIWITTMGENRFHNIVSTVSRASNSGDGADLNHPRP